jgi:hypothetical protein
VKTTPASERASKRIQVVIMTKMVVSFVGTVEIKYILLSSKETEYSVEGAKTAI